ncbi:hypothetical protein NMY22_g17457 [Coprinellus aureogranulatus]|nr:hypothetical protein NMY22_g17457 [Coprinellus aureogranulatus]
MPDADSFPWQISAAPAGTQAATLDIEKFHRTIPVLPAHKPWLVVQGKDGEFYIEHCFPFGCASASSNAGMVANAAVDLCHAQDVGPVLKYEDDLKFLRIPTASGKYVDGGYRYDYDRADVVRVLERLGFPIHKEKGDGIFRSSVDFIGFHWDIEGKEVSLPEKKRRKFLRRVEDFLASFGGAKACSRRDVERIHGSLCHVAFVYVEGRSRLSSLCNFMSDFNRPHRDPDFTHLHLTTSVHSDLQWWADTLFYTDRVRSIRNRGPPVDRNVYVDASTSWGIGIWIDGWWAMLKLYSDWKEREKGRDICWLETVAIELVLYILIGKGVKEEHVLIHSDNQGTVGSVSKGRSRNHHINHSVRRIYDTCVPTGITPSLVYVKSELNPADPLSRGEQGPREKKLQTSHITLPADLRSVMFFLLD